MFSEIERTIQNLDAEGEKPDFDEIRRVLHDALDKLDGLKVQGFDNVDKLFGCMIYFKKLLGEEVKTNGR